MQAARSVSIPDWRKRQAGRRQRQESERERRKDRKRGGQPGHQGTGLARDPDPGEREEAEPPAECRRCGSGLAGAADAGSQWAQVIDVKVHPQGDRVGAAGPGVRDVPAGVHAALQRRAERRGQSLQQFLAAELRRLAERPSVDEVLDRIGQRSGGRVGLRTAAEDLAEERADR